MSSSCRSQVDTGVWRDRGSARNADTTERDAAGRNLRQRIGRPPDRLLAPARDHGLCRVPDSPKGHRRHPRRAQRRPNMVNAGFSVQYSIPYLVSKVANVDLPSFLRGMTPMIEVMFSHAGGTQTTARDDPGRRSGHQLLPGQGLGIGHRGPDTRQQGHGQRCRRHRPAGGTA